MFQLTKVWVDPSPDFENVEIRYKWSPLGEFPKFEGDEEAEVMAVVPNTNPRVRQAILGIPRYLKNTDNYSFHYQFIPGGTNRAPISPIFTEEIVAQEVVYVDNEGWATEVRVMWSVDVNDLLRHDFLGENWRYRCSVSAPRDKLIVK